MAAEKSRVRCGDETEKPVGGNGLGKSLQAKFAGIQRAGNAFQPGKRFAPRQYLAGFGFAVIVARARGFSAA